MAVPAGDRLVRLWNGLSGLPGGKRLFSVLVGRMVRYSGSIGARVESLEPGSAILTLRDRPAIRNHLRSIHAVALVNLGELASGLAMLTAIPSGVRGIVTGMAVEFLRKGRGTLRAHGTASPPPVDSAVDAAAVAVISDDAGEVVARINVRWRLAPAMEEHP